MSVSGTQSVPHRRPREIFSAGGFCLPTPTRREPSSGPSPRRTEPRRPSCFRKTTDSPRPPETGPHSHGKGRDRGTLRFGPFRLYPSLRWHNVSRANRGGDRTVAHPCQFLLKRPWVVVPDPQPLFLDCGERQDGLDVPTAGFPIVCVQHSASPTLPDDHDVVQPELDEPVPSEPFMAGAWLSNLHGLPQFRPLDGDGRKPPAGVSDSDQGVQSDLADQKPHLKRVRSQPQKSHEEAEDGHDVGQRNGGDPKLIHNRVSVNTEIRRQGGGPRRR